MEPLNQIGDRITDKLLLPNDETVHHWMGSAAFNYWIELRDWVEKFYPGVFTPDWIYGGKKHGWSLRYKKSKSFCTFLPEYRLFSVVVVLGAAERERFEAQRSKWRTGLLKTYDDAETYHDGKWLKLSITSADELNDVTELLSMKRPRR